MDSPARLPFNGDRYTPFIRTLQFEGLDFTGATFAMQVRDRKDGGALRADLSTVTSASAQGVRLIYAGTDTVANHIAAGRIDEAPDSLLGTDSLTLSLVGIRINETTMEPMPYGTELGDDTELYWDIHITPSGGTKDLYACGPFIVRAGVTQ